MKNSKSLIRALCIIISFLSFHLSVQANGFRLPENTAAGVAMSNALVADANRMSAIAYNPAIMSLQPRNDVKNIMVSASNIQIQYDTEGTAGSQIRKGSGVTVFDIPNLFIGAHLSDTVSFGVLINSPFGLETEWPSGTFSAFLGNASLEPKLSRIKMFNINSNLAFKLSDNTAIAIGLNQYTLRDLQLNSQATVIEGSGSGYGWNAALITKLSNTTSLGISYRSKVAAKATGTAAGVLPIQLDVTFPEMLAIGLNFSVSDNLKLELDIEHIGWDVFDNLNIVRQANGSTVKKSTNNWKNTLTYRVGGQYKINKHQILFGYSYDPTPQGDAYYSARIPGADRQLFSVGYQYDFGTYQLEAGLMLVKFDDRNINSTTTYVPGSEPNGTTAYNGIYRADATVFSLGFNTTF